ncbi:hypothetical protein AB205_0139520, partial [Aquarana catesbeiana]
MFGYTVQQFENEEGKWVLIGSPLEGQPARKTGDVYKCPANGQSKCMKIDLPKYTTIANVTEVKDNMTMGSTLVTNPKGGFMACGPLYAYRCGSMHYTTGICSNVSSKFQVLNSIAPGVQECTTQLDLVIVLDGSNKEAFSEERGARKGVKKVMLVVTDGESHDGYRLPNVIADCEKDGIERYGVAILGYYNRGNISTEKLINEIKSIASDPKEKHFFNVSDELVLSTIAESLGERIFALEGTENTSKRYVGCHNLAMTALRQVCKTHKCIFLSNGQAQKFPIISK